MRQAGQYKGLAKPGIPDEESRKLRVRLIAEELDEFTKASGMIMLEGDNSAIYSTGCLNIVDVADAIADLLYVVYGAAVAWGIKIDPVFGAVHDANMQKFGPGSYQRDDGKWIKPPDWQPPNIEEVLRAQGWDG